MMILVTSTLYNILEKESYNTDGFERLKLSRHEMGKRRLRRKTDMGTDIGVSLKEGRLLHHGDVIVEDGDRRVLVEQIPEKIILISLQNAPRESILLVGHRIGNMHRPMAVSGDIISVPIQADSEIETFHRIFADIADHISIRKDQAVFVPHTGADVHGHQ